MSKASTTGRRPPAARKTELRKLWERGSEADDRKEYARAVKWFRIAAEAGSAEAMNYLGIYYSAGRGVKLDLAKSIEWHKQAYRKSPDGMHASNLALSFRVIGRWDEARKWFERAVELGDGEALLELTHMAICDDDPRAARKLAKRAIHWKGPSMSQMGEERAAWLFYGLHNLNHKGLPKEWRQIAGKDKKK